jgi:hypothetical protein
VCRCVCVYISLTLDRCIHHQVRRSWQADLRSTILAVCRHLPSHICRPRQVSIHEVKTSDRGGCKPIYHGYVPKSSSMLGALRNATCTAFANCLPSVCICAILGFHIVAPMFAHDLCTVSTDGTRWTELKSEYPEFFEEPRHAKIGLCGDGVNPFGQKTIRSMLCIVFAIYNLPVHLRKNYNFLETWGILDGKANTDTVMRILAEDLERAFKTGHVVWDAFEAEYFTHRVMCSAMVHDFMGYAEIAMLNGPGAPVTHPARPRITLHFLRRPHSATAYFVLLISIWLSLSFHTHCTRSSLGFHMVASESPYTL